MFYTKKGTPLVAYFFIASSLISTPIPGWLDTVTKLSFTQSATFLQIGHYSINTFSTTIKILISVYLHKKTSPNVITHNIRDFQVRRRGSFLCCCCGLMIAISKAGQWGSSCNSSKTGSFA